MIGGNPYGVEGNVYIFVDAGKVLNVYKGNVIYGNLSENTIYECIPETNNFYHFGGNTLGKHPKGWKCVPYLIGHYVFVPREMEKGVQKNWKEYIKECPKAEERMVRGICDAYILYNKNDHGISECDISGDN